jgi:hypothetical protein
MLAQAPPENGKLGAAGNGTELKSKPNNTATASIPDQPSVQAQHRSDALTCSPAFREYAAKINAAHHAAYGNAQKAIEKAAECGRLLIEAKAAVGHGDWLPWLAANTEISPRQCQRYMQLAERWGEVKYDAKTHLTLTDAIKAIKTPRQRRAEETKAELEARRAAGETTLTAEQMAREAYGCPGSLSDDECRAQGCERPGHFWAAADARRKEQRAEKINRERFVDAVSDTHAACQSLLAVAPPPLTDEERREVLRELKDARSLLSKIANEVRGGTS